MTQGVVVLGGDQDGGEEHVLHLSVEQVQSVVRCGHQGGLVVARVIVVGALWRTGNRVWF